MATYHLDWSQADNVLASTQDTETLATCYYNGYDGDDGARILYPIVQTLRDSGLAVNFLPSDYKAYMSKARRVLSGDKAKEHDERRYLRLKLGNLEVKGEEKESGEVLVRFQRLSNWSEGDWIFFRLQRKDLRTRQILAKHFQERSYFRSMRMSTSVTVISQLDRHLDRPGFVLTARSGHGEEL